MPSDFTDFPDFAKAFLQNGGIDVLEGYGVIDGKYLGFGSMALPSAQSLTEELIERVIGDLMSKGFINEPMPGDLLHVSSPLVVFHMPPGGVFEGSSGKYSGMRELSKHQRFYAVVCDTTLTENHAAFTPRMARSVIWSHLVSEWAVNPLGDGWYDHDTGVEIADLCTWRNDVTRFAEPAKDWWINKVYCVGSGSESSPYREPRVAENAVVAESTEQDNTPIPMDPKIAQEQVAQAVEAYNPDHTGRDEAMAVCNALSEFIAGAATAGIIPLDNAAQGLIWIGWFTRNLYTDMTANASLKEVINSFQTQIGNVRKLPDFSAIGNQGAKQ